jgi:hypothetical protein
VIVDALQRHARRPLSDISIDAGEAKLNAAPTVIGIGGVI